MHRAVGLAVGQIARPALVADGGDPAVALGADADALDRRGPMRRVLWPVLDEFCRLYPEVQPDVQLDDRIGNWVEDRVDVGFRVGPSPAEGVVARKLFALSSSSARRRPTWSAMGRRAT